MMSIIYTRISSIHMGMPRDILQLAMLMLDFACRVCRGLHGRIGLGLNRFFGRWCVLGGRMRYCRVRHHEYDCHAQNCRPNDTKPQIDALLPVHLIDYAGPGRAPQSSRTDRSRSALAITETEDRLIAAAASMGDNINPSSG